MIEELTALAEQHNLNVHQLEPLWTKAKNKASKLGFQKGTPIFFAEAKKILAELVEGLAQSMVSAPVSEPTAKKKSKKSD